MAARAREQMRMAAKFPVNPSHPERIYWGCDKLCPAESLACGSGSVRTPHLAELAGPDWQTWGLDAVAVRSATIASPMPLPASS